MVASFFGNHGQLHQVSAEQVVEAFGFACGYGQVNVVDFLLERGVDPNVTLDILGGAHSALRVAMEWGHADVVERLLRAGATP